MLKGILIFGAGCALGYVVKETIIDIVAHEATKGDQEAQNIIDAHAVQGAAIERLCNNFSKTKDESHSLADMSDPVLETLMTYFKNFKPDSTQGGSCADCFNVYQNAADCFANEGEN